MKANIYNFKCWIGETDPNKLKKNMAAYLREAGFEVLKVAGHNFEPDGYTCVWIIAESHLAIHTWPEEKTTYLELSSCNLEKQEAFIDILMERCDLLFNQPCRMINTDHYEQ